MRSIAYVDGFNLYYRALRNTPHKWLDLACLIQTLVPDYTLQTTKYFTAHIAGNDAQKATRQQVYLRALRASGCDVILGTFRQHKVKMRNAAPPPPYVLVIKTEEKGSDVNLASHLLLDAFNDRYDAAIVVTNDSDLAMPIRMVRTHLNRKVIVVSPGPDRVTKTLVQAADGSIRKIRPSLLRLCQFPDRVRDKNGTITKPSVW